MPLRLINQWHQLGQLEPVHATSNILGSLRHAGEGINLTHTFILFLILVAALLVCFRRHFILFFGLLLVFLRGHNGAHSHLTLCRPPLLLNHGLFTHHYQCDFVHDVD